MSSNVVHRLQDVLTNERPARWLPIASAGATPGRPTLARIGWVLLLSGILLSLFTIQPVAAQSSNPVCSGDSGTLPNMIEGFIQLTTALGLMGLLVIWQADELMEMFTLAPEQKQTFVSHKRSAMKSAAVLVVLGPLYTIAGSVMGLPIAQCVDVVPF